MNLRLARCLIVLLFVCIGAGLSSHAQRKPSVEPWKKWTRNPLGIPVTVTATNIKADVGMPVLITLSDGKIEQAGAGCTTVTNAPSFSTALQPRREYQLTIVSSNFTSLDLKLAWASNWSPLGTKGKGSKPKNYKLLVDRQWNGNGEIAVSYGDGGPCGVFSNTWTIELTERIPANWLLDDGSDDPAPAVGDGVWVDLGPGMSMEKSRAAYSWSVGLGRLMDGRAVGRLSLRDDHISLDTFRPTNLFFLCGSEIVRSEIQLLTSVGPTLRQIKTHHNLVDIVDLTNSTEMRFYFTNQVGTATNNQGHFTNITGNPFVTWELLNPAPPATNELRIIERRDGLSRTNYLTYDPNSSTATWTLKYGTGATERIETRGITISTNGPTNRVEVVDIRYAGASSPAYKATETYQLFNWGFELTETRIDPDNNSGTSNDLVTTIAFNTDPDDPVSYRKPRTIIHPDGYWEKRTYDNSFTPGPLNILFTPHLDDISNPESATTANSVWSQYSYASYELDTLTISRGYADGSYNAFRNEQRGKYAAGDYDNSFDGAREMTATPWFVGLHTSNYADYAGYGLASHPVYKKNFKDAEEVSYYHGGTLSGTTFTTNSADIWTGPDWRKSTIFTGVRGTNDLANIVSLTFTEAEGQPLPFLSAYGCYAYVNESWKETEIYQQGSLAIKQMFVFTGVTDGEPQFELVTTMAFKNDSLGHATNIVQIDAATGVSRLIYEASYRGTTSDTDLLAWERDENGVKTIYSYDSLKRRTESRQEGVSASGAFPAQVDRVQTFSFDAYGRTLSTISTAGTLSLTNSAVFDLSGRPITLVDEAGLTNSFAYELGGRRTIKTMPSGRTEIRENYLDRRLKSITGTGVVAEYHNWKYADLDDYSEDWNWTINGEDGRGRIWHEIKKGATDSLRVIHETVDWIGKTNHVQSADFSDTNGVAHRLEFFLGGAGQYELPQHKHSTTRGIFSGYGRPVEVYGYDFAGRQNLVSIPLDNGSSVTNARVSASIVSFEKLSGHWFQTTSNLVCRAFGSSTPTTLQVVRARLNGFSSSNTVSQVTTIDADGNSDVTTVTVDRALKKLFEISDTAKSTLNATNITVNGLLQAVSSPSVATPIRYGYDSLGRQIGITNSLGFAQLTSFNLQGQVATSADPAGVTTSFTYYLNGEDGAGQVRSQMVDGRTSYQSYTNSGIWRVWGDVPYPEERLYDQFGDLVELRTFQDGAGWSGSSWPTGATGSYNSTRWLFQEETGLLVAKVDAANQTNSFTYWQGRPLQNTLARGITSTRVYNDLGDLLAIDYSDSTPDITYTNSVDMGYSRTGLPLYTKDGSGEWLLRYDHADRLSALVCTNGDFNGITVSNLFNAVNGKDRIYISGPSAAIDTTYGFDTYGRIASITSGTGSATYGYTANSDLLATTTFKNSTTTRLTATRGWEFGARLKSIQNVAGTATVSAHTYWHDAGGRRQVAVLADESFWRYEYNGRDEVTSGKRFWSDRSPVSGQQFAYEYDSIGNRIEADFGGDVNGANLRTVAYDANALNQYGTVTTPGYKDIVGASWAANTVTVNGGGTDRKGEYFHAELSISNGSAPIWQSVSVLANGVTTSGGLVFPKNAQTYAYDADGNLTFDGVWAYHWDAENRLTQMVMTNVSGIANSERKKLVFAYNHASQRTKKTVYAWSTNNAFSSTPDLDVRYVYDGWNLQAELNASNNAIIRRYAWGLDLSGTVEDAGGVGGLVLMNDGSANHFPAYDGNGNVMGLVKGDGTVSANYEYSPFGETIRATGTMSRDNPFQFSSKYFDHETGLNYYGHRYYQPITGRWLNKDPIEEDGGINLYAFVSNSGIGRFDALGQAPGDQFGAVPNWFKKLIHGLVKKGELAKGPNGQVDVKDLNEKYKELMKTYQGDKKAIEREYGNKRKTVRGGRGGFGSALALSLGLSMLEATYHTVSAADRVGRGEFSEQGTFENSVEMFLFGAMNGADTAMTDLESITLALEQTGGAGAEAATAWLMYQLAAEAVSE